MVLWGVLLSAGCKEEAPIRTYTAPKPPRHRIVGTIVPRDGTTWFFKAVGVPAEIQKKDPALRAFFSSVRFEKGAPVWTLPAGWSDGPASGMRFATLKVDEAVELAVTRLDGDGGGLAENVNRWRGQLGLAPLAEAEVAALETIPVDGAPARLCDFTGRWIKTSRAMPASHPTREESPPHDMAHDITFELPSGWSQNPSPRQGRMLEFRAGEAEVTVMQVGGGVAANVNRWRGQVGMPELPDAEAEALALPMSVMKGDGRYVELIGPERGILCAFVQEGTGAIFFKLTGPAAVAVEQREPFKAFIASLGLRRHE